MNISNERRFASMVGLIGAIANPELTRIVLSRMVETDPVHILQVLRQTSAPLLFGCCEACKENWELVLSSTVTQEHAEEWHNFAIEVAVQVYNCATARTEQKQKEEADRRMQN